MIVAFTLTGLMYNVDCTGQTTSEIIGEGWEHIGTRKINKKLDRDEIPVTVADGNYKKVILIAEKKGIIFKQCIIEFDDDTRQIVNMRNKVDSEEAAPEIDLTGGGKKVIRNVIIAYDAKSKKGKVRLYGMR